MEHKVQMFAGYASFLLATHFQEVVQESIRLSMLHAKFPSADSQTMAVQIEERMKNFLLSVSQGTVIAMETKALQNLVHTQPLPFHSAKTLQLLENNYFRKQCLLKFLPAYTTDPQQIISIVLEIEQLETQLMGEASQVGMQIQQAALYEQQAQLQAKHDEMLLLNEKLQLSQEELLATNNELHKQLHQLQEREHFISHVVDTTPDVIRILDLTDIKIIYANRELTKVLGYTPQQLTNWGNNYMKHIVVAEDLPMVYAHLQELADAEDNKIYTIEYRVFDAWGQKCWLRTRETIFRRDNTGKVIQVLSITANITDIKLAEEKRSYQEMLLKESQAVAQLGNWEMDLIENKIYGSAEFYRIFCIDISQTLELPAILLNIHPEDIGGLQEKVKNARELGQEYTYEYRYTPAGQSLQYHFVKSWPVKNEQGKISKLRGVIQDITPTKQAEQELKQAYLQLKKSNEELLRTEELLKELNNELEQRVEQRTSALAESNFRFQLIAEATNDAVWYRVFTEKKIRWNQSFENVFGYLDDSERNYSDFETWLKRVHPDDVQAATYTIEQAIARGHNFWKTEYRFKRADGTYAFVLDRGRIIFDTTGQPFQLLGSMMDISELKLTEQKLKEKNIELKKINTDLDNFIYTASHDLKNPVLNLEGLLSILNESLENKIEPADKKWMDLMQVALNRLKKTIHDLTEISKIQKGTDEAAEILTFTQVIEDIQLDNTRLITEANARIITDFKVTHIRYPAKNLRSILHNLLTNAIKYRSPNRQPEIRIATFQEKNYIVLTVTDNGLGFDPTQKEKVFAMFKRLHTHVEGTGIGLYMIKRMIENYGGSIEVDSTLGHGSTFKVFFNDSLS